MNILLLLIIIPILTIIGILFTRDNKQVRVVSAIGMTFQLITSAIIIPVSYTHLTLPTNREV